MKKIAPYIIVFLATVLLMNVFGSHDVGVNFDGDHIDGPVGALLGLFFGGLGIVIAGIVMVVVGIVLAVVFAGMGVIAIAAIAIALVCAVLAVSPLMLPLLVPVAIIWFFMGRSRRQRERAQAEQVKAEPV
jgi:hypothetical protein